MSELRPGWLADDTEWQRQLRAMPSDDRNWIEQHWDIAGGAPPGVDLSWITFETIGHPDWVLVLLVVGGALATLATTVAVVYVTWWNR